MPNRVNKPKAGKCDSCGTTTGRRIIRCGRCAREALRDTKFPQDKIHKITGLCSCSNEYKGYLYYNVCNACDRNHARSF